MDNNDPQLLRVWIRRKYLDKAWLDYNYNEAEEEEKKESGRSSFSDEKKVKKKKSKAKNSSGATIVSVPPKTASAPEVDLFGGWDAPETNNKAPDDPFSSNVNTSSNDPFVADFDSQPPAQKNDPFVADFNAPSASVNNDPFVADFNSQPTNNKNDPFKADFSSQQNNQKNDPFVADFDSQPQTNTVKKEEFVADFSNNSNQSQMQQPTFQANFDSQPKNPSIQKEEFVADFSNNGNQSQMQQSAFQADFSQSQAQSNSSFPPVAQMQNTSFNTNFDQNNQVQPMQSDFNPSFESAPPSSQPQNFGNFPSQTFQQKQPEQAKTMDTTDKEERDPFDAFSGLSINQNENSMNNVPSKSKAESKYTGGQSIFYKEKDGTKTQVKIVKVHLDDDLEPFYTIQFSTGREKQTDDAHLTESAEVESIAVDDIATEANVTLSNEQAPPDSSEVELAPMPNNGIDDSNFVNTNGNMMQPSMQQQPPMQQSNGIDSSNFTNTNGNMMQPSMQQQPQMQTLGIEQLTQMIQNLSFQELLMIQQVITTKMQEIQMQQHSQMMAMSAGMNQANSLNNATYPAGNQMNMGGAMNPVQPTSLPPQMQNSPAQISSKVPDVPPPPPPEEAPPPPPQLPPPQPPVEKKGNPFDSF